MSTLYPIQADRLDSSGPQESNSTVTIFAKIKKIWNSIIPKTRVNLSNDLNASLITESPSSTPSSLPSRIKNYVKNRRFIVTTCSITGMVSSAVLLSSLLTEISTNCFQAEVRSQSAFNDCNQPYTRRLIIYNSVLAAASFALGYLLQSVIGQRKSPIDEPPQDLSTNRSYKVFNFIRHKILDLQEHYTYEALLLLIYLYNGISINVSDDVSFKAFLSCNSAGISLAAAAFGMYARVQKIQLRHLYPMNPLNTVSRNNLIETAGFAIGTMLITILPGLSLSLNTSNTLREVSLIVLSRKIGHLSLLWLDKIKNRRPSANYVINCLKFQTPIIIGSYCLYVIPETFIPNFIGLFSLGIALGGKHYFYRNNQEPDELLLLDFPPEPFSFNPKNLIKNYAKTEALIAFSILLARLQFLNCKGPPTPYNYSCPLGLEFSGYLSGNLVVIESFGVNIVIMAGLFQFHIRALCRHLKHCSFPIVKKTVIAYLKLNNTYQNELIALIFYTLIKSGKRLQDYENAFYTYDPIIPLILLGTTIGNNRERKKTFKQFLRPVTGWSMREPSLQT